LNEQAPHKERWEFKSLKASLFYLTFITSGDYNEAVKPEPYRAHPSLYEQEFFGYSFVSVAECKDAPPQKEVKNVIWKTSE
jgi:hypothetical protein